jgi:hypothetical protein
VGSSSRQAGAGEVLLEVAADEAEGLGAVLELIGEVLADHAHLVAHHVAVGASHLDEEGAQVPGEVVLGGSVEGGAGEGLVVGSGLGGQQVQLVDLMADEDARDDEQDDGQGSADQHADGQPEHRAENFSRCHVRFTPLTEGSFA